jgi:hypothetical protein
MGTQILVNGKNALKNIEKNKKEGITMVKLDITRTTIIHDYVWCPYYEDFVLTDFCVEQCFKFNDMDQEFETLTCDYNESD